MNTFVSLLGLVFSYLPVDTKEIKLQNVDSAYMAKQMQKFSSEAKLSQVAVSPSEKGNAVTVVGTSADIAQMQRLISLFDAKSKEVTLTITVRSPQLGWTQTSTIQTRNMAKWAYADEMAGIQFSIHPRINDDGTVTILFDSFVQSAEGFRAIRFTEDQVGKLCLTREGETIALFEDSSIPKDPKAIVTIRYSLPEKVNKAS